MQPHPTKGELKHWCKAHMSAENLLLHNAKVWASLVWLTLHRGNKILYGL